MSKKDFLQEIKTDSDSMTLTSTLNWIDSNKVSIDPPDFMGPLLHQPQ